ncbi:MAG: PAC2 family protein [Microthrixaceae bacterium]|nr:PAC2 family protein [Microthrixaceae bacterium]
MGYLRWELKPPSTVAASTHTVMVAAFTGWNDGAEAAGDAIDHLWEQWDAQSIAEVTPDDFVDFTVSRPTMDLHDGVPSDIQWPSTRLGWCTPDPSLSVVLVKGPEPGFGWPAFCHSLIGAADELGASTMITLGAMLSDVPHTRPAPIFCAAREEHILASIALPRSNYGGPVGIPSVLAEFAHRRGLESLGLWAAVPGYTAGVPSIKGVLGLLDALERILDVDVDTTGFAEAADEYTTYLDALVAEDSDTAEYVLRLEEAYDRADDLVLGSSTDLVVEVEDFLREL